MSVSRAAQLREMKAKAEAAAKEVTARKAQAAAVAAKALESKQALIMQRQVVEAAAAAAAAAEQVTSARSQEEEAVAFMSYEDQPPVPVPDDSRDETGADQQHQQVGSPTQQAVLGHFAHALSIVFGGDMPQGEASFLSTVSFALDRLFRSFGRSKPGRGSLNYPEFAGALRDTVKKHGLDSRYIEKDVLADLFMVCDSDSDGYVKDFELR